MSKKNLFMWLNVSSSRTMTGSQVQQQNTEVGVLSTLELFGVGGRHVIVACRMMFTATFQQTFIVVDVNFGPGIV